MRLVSHGAPQPPVAREPAGRLDRLAGSLVAMVTPFGNGTVDHAALALLCERQVRAGTAALVVCGSTGEAASLSPAEHARVVAVAVEAAAARVPVIAGCGAPSTDAAADLALAAARNGASALLSAPPPYVRPTQAGIASHIHAVARAADLPVILYDVPARTGVAVADETVARLFQCGVVAGIKDAAGDLSRPPRLRALCGPELLQFTGDDATVPAYLAMGGHGCISVTANVLPGLSARMHLAWRGGDLDEVGRVRDLLAPLHDALFHETNPIPVKAALSLIGLCDDGMRLPLTRATADTVARLSPLLRRLLPAEDEVADTPRLSLVR